MMRVLVYAKIGVIHMAVEYKFDKQLYMHGACQYFALPYKISTSSPSRTEVITCENRDLKSPTVICIISKR